MSLIQFSTRRDFFASGLGLVCAGAGAAVPNFLVQTAMAGPQAANDERILVVVQLSGGHDGLSAVVPFNNDDYNRNRKTTRIAANNVIKINDELGFHPDLTSFKTLMDEDDFAVVQGVGYPNPNRSHFKSMDIWHLANNKANTQSSSADTSAGWIGKYCDSILQDKNDPQLALSIGTGKAPLAIRGLKNTGLSFSQPDKFRYLGSRNNKKRAASYQMLQKKTSEESSNVLDFISQTSLDANASSEIIRKLASKYQPEVSYPRTRLAASLSTVASLIAGGLSTRVYYVSQGGFDTHAGQKNRHDQLMQELGAAVSAFQKDIVQQGNGDRVLSMCFSEFGRRVKENASQGTDHGVAGPMFLFGQGVKAGIHGEHPSLAAKDLIKGDIKHSIDFRSVYATVLDKWMGASSDQILGEKFPHIDCVKG